MIIWFYAINKILKIGVNNWGSSPRNDYAENRLTSLNYNDGTQAHRVEYSYGADSFVRIIRKYVDEVFLIPKLQHGKRSNEATQR